MLHLVINQTAGSGFAKKVGEKVIQWLTEEGRPHSVSYTEGPGHAEELAKSAVTKGAETVIAVGGDGTVCETARGLLGTKTALGVVPAGTGNDFAKALGMPKKPREALSFIFDHPARPVDAGRVNDLAFFNVCGTGFDVCVLDYTLAAKKYVRGMLPYLWGVIRTIFTFQSVNATVQLDGGEKEQHSVLILSVANGPCFGGGIKIAPEAKPNDGFFEFITIDHMPRWRIAFQLPRLVSGKVDRIPGFSQRRCKSVLIEAENMRINLDGEIIPVNEAAFEMLEGALMAHY